MNTNIGHLDELGILHKLHHYLPQQAALKDFIHHNTLHAFQDLHFKEGIRSASCIFGYRTTLSLEEYRQLYKQKIIKKDVLERVITAQKGTENVEQWRKLLLHHQFKASAAPRIGQLRALWKESYGINLDKIVHPQIFRLLGNYLDQGISTNQFPYASKGFLAAIKELERNSLTGIFKTERAKKLLHSDETSIASLLHIVVGDYAFYEQYLFDQQFAHPGWSGFVSVVEHQPDTLLDKRSITLGDLVTLELILEIDALDQKFGVNWKPIGFADGVNFIPTLFAEVPSDDLNEILYLWQEAYEWSYYDEVLSAIKHKEKVAANGATSFQALLCIDDRNHSVRRHLESTDPQCKTYGTPGFFGVEFFFKPEHGKFYTKACPAPVTPKYVIKETDRRKSWKRDAHYSKKSHQLLRGWLISQTLGFWSALKLFVNIFKPSIHAATAHSFQHMDKHSVLTVESSHPPRMVNGLQVGFTVSEMADRVEKTLRSIGLSNDFADIVYVVGHGASSVNNTHYAGYDCGACSGRPGAVNARVFAHMANHPVVRHILAERNLVIPKSTVFVGAMHDTTRDEIEYYDEDKITVVQFERHLKHQKTFSKALAFNALERSRMFASVDSTKPIDAIHERIKERSFSLFEPRPELNHAKNALCIVGRSSLAKGLFLDTKPFMNSYDPTQDHSGDLLQQILGAAIPVCGGINLEYYFSRVDQLKLGAGTKLPHNVIGLFGVANGVDGDLRTGLPSQMIELTDPRRLLFIVEQTPDMLLKVLKRMPAAWEWVNNEWVKMVAVDPTDYGRIWYFRNGDFKPYATLGKPAKKVEEIWPLMLATDDNLPVLEMV